MAALEGEVLPPESEEQRRARERLRALAWLLDSSIRVPGTRLTVGIEALLGLVPLLGDLLGVLASTVILAEAQRLGVPRAVMARMALNVALEGLVGIVPLAGDLFDAAWKANQRNVRLLDAWADRPRETARASRAFVVLLAASLVAFVAACGYLGYLALLWLLG